jgi:hypothetical protein
MCSLQFSITRSEEDFFLKMSDPSIWLSVCIKFMEGWIKTYNPPLVYSQIWLNLSNDVLEFLKIYLWMVANVASKQKSLQEPELV